MPRVKHNGERAAASPHDYQQIALSLYVRDIEKLDRIVEELKRRGHTKASRSWLVRFMLDRVDIAEVPSPMELPP